VEREDIEFRTRRGAWVEVAVRVRNEGRLATEPATLRLEWADLGVHLPWNAGTTLTVPPLAPGGAAMVGTSLPLLPAPANRVDPLVLRPGLALLQRVARAQVDVPRTGRGFLRPDLHALLGLARAQWAGNVRVEIGGAQVERHLAPSVPVAVGRANVSLFMVGRMPGEYRFTTRGDAAAWDHRLVDLRTGRALPLDGVGRVSALGSTFWMLGAVARPEAKDGRGTLEVVVRHEPSGAEQSVEFDLDPDAPGPVCTLEDGAG
jgi:hypothetical protein